VWQQFRVQYPTGSLTAELITIHDGLFVVRAIARVDEKTMVTGFAAAMTIEEAEDRARTRALLMLGLSPNAPTSLSSPHPLVATLPVEARSRSVSPGESPRTPLPPVEVPTPTWLPKDELESAGLANEEEESMATHDRFGSVADMTTPTDDSDLMIKTTIEIRRLGWSNEQGRHHLETTYGKRSRQHLTREELLDFLQYLETLD
jgi:hypothetical protein